MVEGAFLRVIETFLTTQANLVPAPATVGVIEPADVAAMPAVVLALAQTKRLGNGLGERSALITHGTLQWSATVDLANPVLPEDPSFRLLSDDRTQLVLPHGGLVRADGTQGPLGPADLTVTVAGVSSPVVTGPPAGDQVRADPLVGKLMFATPLPATGPVAANYFLGQWEQRVERMAGMLQVFVKDTDANVVRDLSNSVVDALQTGAASAVSGLHGMSVVELGSIRPPDPNLANARTRVAQFSFEFELEVNRPESSGGIIQRIPVNANVG